jgi:hypothetical protein
MADESRCMDVKIKPEDARSLHVHDPQWNETLTEAMQAPLPTWQEPDFSAIHSAKSGLLLGALAGCVSLLMNVIGSVLWPAISGIEQHPLRLIQVYLTFPLGESALKLQSGGVLAFGCLLYLGTGMLYGMLFETAIAYFVPRARAPARLAFCSILALLVWLVNFYCLIAWIQPLLFGGRWVVELIPWWVAVLTHLAFGWTLALIYPLGIPARDASHTTLDQSA